MTRHHDPKPFRGLPLHGASLERRSGRVTRPARAVGRDLVYLTAVLASSIAGFVVWTVGVSVTLSVAVLVFGVLLWVPAASACAGRGRRSRGSSAGTGTAGGRAVPARDPDGVIERSGSR